MSALSLPQLRSEFRSKLISVSPFCLCQAFYLSVPTVFLLCGQIFKTVPLCHVVEETASSSCTGIFEIAQPAAACVTESQILLWFGVLISVEQLDSDKRLVLVCLRSLFDPPEILSCSSASAGSVVILNCPESLMINSYINTSCSTVCHHLSYKVAQNMY